MTKTRKKMTENKKERKFTLEITVPEDGKPQTRTRNQGLPYEVIVSSLSQQLYLYNNLWAKHASATFEEKD